MIVVILSFCWQLGFWDKKEANIVSTGCSFLGHDFTICWKGEFMSRAASHEHGGMLFAYRLMGKRIKELKWYHESIQGIESPIKQRQTWEGRQLVTYTNTHTCMQNTRNCIYGLTHLHGKMALGAKPYGFGLWWEFRTLQIEHLEYLMSEQKRVRNMCDVIVSIFYRPLGHKEEMQGVFLTSTILVQEKFKQWNGNCPG